ncbi:MAG: DUF3352 domain-containing protein [Synechococcus sp.]|nr:DUF3352 domain-containing protein [Synechococcus sp.]
MNKFRPPLAVLLAMAITLVSLGIGGWWWLQRQSPLQLQRQSLSAPVTSRFLPRSANLSVVLELDPALLPAYGRAVAAAKQRSTTAARLEQLRDGLFASAGLDYTTELADWLGVENGLALKAATEPGQPPAWVLALTSRTENGARLFLQRFWQSRSLAGSDLEIARYRGLGLISSRGPRSSSTNGATHPPMATALVNDQLVLLASSRSALEDALDASQEEALNQAGEPLLQEWLSTQPTGVALLRTDATGLEQLLGLPAELQPQQAIEQLVGSLALRRDGVQLNAMLQTAAGAALAPLSADGDALLEQLHLPAGRLSLSQPGGALPQLFNLPASGDLLPALLHHRDGPLLQAQLSGTEAWLAGSRPDHPPTAALDAQLEQAGFDAASLGELRVWTHLTAETNKEGQLKASLAGGSGSDGGLRWWSNNLDSLRAQLKGRHQKGVLKQQLRKLDPEFNAQALLALDGNGARQLLGRWPLWRGLQLLAGQPLAPSLQGIAIALEQDQQRASLQAQLNLR